MGGGWMHHLFIYINKFFHFLYLLRLVLHHVAVVAQSMQQTR